MRRAGRSVATGSDVMGCSGAAEQLRDARLVPGEDGLELGPLGGRAEGVQLVLEPALLTTTLGGSPHGVVQSGDRARHGMCFLPVDPRHGTRSVPPVASAAGAGAGPG